MATLTLKLINMAHGGAAIGHDRRKRPIFVPYAIPGETVKATITMEKKNFARAELLEVVDPSPKRTEPRCKHFGVCGGCHFQHIVYEEQLTFKRAIVIDQLQRIGGVKNAPVQPVLPHPSPWEYRIDVSLSPTQDGRLGFWAPAKQEVIPIDNCPLIDPQLQQLWSDVDIALPDLRKLTLRVGDDGALLAAFEVDNVEPPELEVDFPVSAAIVLPNRTAASLIGDHYLVQAAHERDFRVSPGCFFQPSPIMAEALIDVALRYAQLSGEETVVEGYSGVGMLTSFLADNAAAVMGIETNPDAVEDAAVNLETYDNISLYEGHFAAILPALDVEPDVIVVNPPNSGLGKDAVVAIAAKRPSRLIYASADIATLSRDAKQLMRAGYQLAEIQPLDMTPHHFQIDTVSLWTPSTATKQ